MTRARGDAALAVGFVLVWGTAFNSARLVVAEWPPLWALAIRFALTAPLLLALMLAFGHRLPRGAGDLARVAAMGALGVGGYLALSWVALGTVPSGLVALVTAATPLLVALGEVALGRGRPSALGWAGLGLGWAGVAVLGGARALGVGAAPGEPDPLGGVLLALLASASQAAGVLAFGPARARVDLWAATFGQGVVTALLLLALAPLLEGPAPPGLADASAPTLLGLAYSVLVVGVGGYAMLFALLRRFPASTAASLQLLAPPVAALVGWAALGERLAWTDLAGGAVTLLGLAMLFGARRVAAPGRG